MPASSAAPRSLARRATETIIAALGSDRQALTREAADLVYHLLVLLESRTWRLDDVLAELRSRMGTSGLAEKAARATNPHEHRRTILLPWSQRASARSLARFRFSPYRVFSREEWAKLRADTPMTLVPRELEQLSGLIEDLSMVEVEQIYLPLSRLLNLHVAAAQELHAVTNRFLGRGTAACPTSSASPARWRSARAPPRAC